MKKSIKKIIEETFQNKSDWNYYAKAGEEFNENPMHSKPNAIEFLKKFIDLSGKADVTLVENISELRGREFHVVSAFFIGHYIYKNSILKGLVDKEIAVLKQKSGVKSRVNFSFLWFMTCLFHDLGYNYEEKSNPHFPTYNNLVNRTDKLLEVNGVPKLYSNVCEKYFEYRFTNHSKNDHGIIGAHILFRELADIRKKAEIDPKNNQKGLTWEKALQKVYNFIAWNILAHNIWYVKAGDKNWSHYKYMQDLRLNENEYKISVNEHPFFFLFCLVDTIEPYKKVLDYKSLKKVSIDIKKDKVIVSTSLKSACGQKIIGQASGLADWLTTTKLSTENSVEIHFEPNIN